MSEALQQLVEIVSALRAEGGCPWDRRQTHKTMARYMEEEAFEAIEAIESGDDVKMRDELGDVLFQVAFHAQLAQERSSFCLDDVALAINQKMIRRHPHVFGEDRTDDPELVRRRWEEIKSAERTDRRESLMDGVPKGLSALTRANRVQSRAATVGVVFPDVASALAQVEEEYLEFREALESGLGLEEELGDLLFSLVALARQKKLDPEAALRATVRKFLGRFERLEQKHGHRLAELSLEEMRAAWQEAR